MVYYALKYATKDQHDIQNYMQLYSAALDKPAAGKETDTDLQKAGRRRIQSVATTLTKPLETGGPMCCLYFINPTAPFYHSHDYISINLSQAIAMLNRQPVPVALGATTEYQHDIQCTTQVHDYIYKPQQLHIMSFLAFRLEYAKKRAKKGLPLQPHHPQHHTHKLQPIPNPHHNIPLIHAKRLPNIQCKTLEAKDELYFYQHIILLHKPYTSLQELPTPTELH